jgi:hypothetical protein
MPQAPCSDENLNDGTGVFAEPLESENKIGKSRFALTLFINR